MSKLIIKDNYRVEVDPPLPFYFRTRKTPEEKAKDMESACRDVMQQIQRHVDQEGVRIIWDTHELCSYCGYDWEVDKDGPVCCEKAQQEWKEQQENNNDS